MARIVFITSSIASILNANLEFARRLQAAGHDVIYTCCADCRAVVTAHGLHYLLLEKQAQKSPAETKEASGALGKLSHWLAKWTTIQQRQQKAVQELGGQELDAELNALSPDLVLIDIELHEYIIAACSLQLRVALLSTWISILKRRGIPPLHLGIVPGSGWRGSVWGIEWAWLKYRLWKRLNIQLQRLRAVGADPSSVLRRYARKRRFPFKQEIDPHQWLMPFSYRTLPVLCLNARELDFPHTPPSTIHYVGPMILRERKAAVVEQELDGVDAALATLFERREAAGGSSALIYCAFGAFFKGDDTAFLSRVLHAVAGHGDWDVVLGLGGRLNLKSLGTLPPNVHAFAWVPQVQVLQRADCAVVHAGISTLNECIHFGVPMLVYPFKKTTDQLGNAARIAYHGLGLVADRDADDTDAIAKKITGLLTDSTYKVHLNQMGEQFERYARDNFGVRAVQELLSRDVLGAAQHAAD